eukprot:CAMPEP_0171544872 /NCGR_PEP_ID=MMETSP0960-20121227/3755_1 /TAXON_ID=87120 /ORGANISM="Aurantiochytrium limacinum, Strain ATCCMYA-1381" /LENGTH=98 /DNA_ID=CAMNT_0012092755 /DNA_START=764 /DNA_END=1057 /DNA_ORIENTATION=-
MPPPDFSPEYLVVDNPEDSCEAPALFVWSYPAGSGHPLTSPWAPCEVEFVSDVAVASRWISSLLTTSEDNSSKEFEEATIGTDVDDASCEIFLLSGSS